MKKYYPLLLLLALVLPLGAQKQPSEKVVNGEYRTIILNHLRQDVSTREGKMQKRANAMLLNLPLDEKLYDESKFRISARIEDGRTPDGRTELNYVVTITYNSTSIEGASDDYPQGGYLVQQSNSARALCAIAKQVVDEYSSDLFVQGKEVTVRIASSADGQPVSHLPYGGEYGERRYDAARYNTEPVRLSLSPTEGINTNAQLAFARAVGVEHTLRQTIESLARTTNHYEYETFCTKEIGPRHRRVSLEFVVHAAFDEKILEMNQKLVNDQYVDYNIPTLPAGTNKETYVVIVANEGYDAPLPDCDYALNDGQAFQRYCVQTLGIPARHIRLLENASIDELRTDGIRWLLDITTASRGRANIILYYAGHGFSDPDYKPYLLFSDVNTRQIRSWNGRTELDPDAYLSRREANNLMAQSLPLDTLCAWFNRVPNLGITFILDCGFNGAQRNGEPLINLKRSDARVKGLRIRQDIVIFAAADVTKTAYAFADQRHGFLTYYLLHELKRTRGDIAYGPLYESILKDLGYESSLQGRLQEPIVIGGGKLKESWTTRRFK